MSFLEGVRIALGAIRTNLLRSFLTLLGIIIGIGAIISVIAIINGLNLYVAENLSNFGTNVFVVQRIGLITNNEEFMDALRRNKKLKPEDARALERNCKLSEAVAMEVHTTEDLRRGAEEVHDVDVGGIEPAIIAIEPYDVAEGRTITEEENGRAATVCFIGHDIAVNLFGPIDPIGKQLRIRDREFEVVGTAKQKGSVFGFSRDNYVKIPFTTLRKIFGSQRSVNISVKAADGVAMEDAMDEARAVLRARHHLRYGDPDDFGFLTSEGINDLWHDLTQTIFLVAIFVVGISLVVGGIVIMNIMLVSVMERTREIGVRKAIGARRQDILTQVLIESATLSMVGALLGVALGVGLALIVRAVTPLPATVAPKWILLGVAMGVGTGIAAGVYPASRAARLHPVDALRHE